MATTTAATQGWRGSGEILLADDEAYVRRVARRAIERAGFQVVECADGAEALAMVEAEPVRFAAVMLDLTMPRLAGDAALEKIRARNPALPAVLYSGYSAEELNPSLRALAATRFLQKPFTTDEVATALHDVIDPSAPA